MSQTELSVGHTRVDRNSDYAKLFPPHVYPTGDLDVLEQNKNLLFIKSMPYGKKPTDKQMQIWKLLAGGYSNPDAPGSIAVCLVWGLGSAAREWVVIDHMGVSATQAGAVNDWRAYLLSWFNAARVR